MSESPLAEVDPKSIDELLDRINDHLAAEQPDMIRKEQLFEAMIANFRTQAEKWQADEMEGKSHRKTGSKTKNPIREEDLKGLI